MKPVAAAMSGAALAAALAVAPSARAEERVVNIGAVDEVSVVGQFRVRIEVGAEPGLRLEGSPRDLDDIEISQSLGELEIRQDVGFLSNQRLLDVDAVVTVPRLTELHLSRGLKAEVVGVSAGRFELDVSKGTVAEVSGACESLDVDVSMGAVLRARDLKCADVDADASMGAVAYVFAGERFNGGASMGGIIRVDGAPNRRSSSGSFGGDVAFVGAH